MNDTEKWREISVLAAGHDDNDDDDDEVLLFITNNSIKHQLFVYTQLMIKHFYF